MGSRAPVKVNPVDGTMMVKHYILCFNKEDKLEHFEVPGEVAIYIRQLETYIKHPTKSRLKVKYHFRFLATSAK